jgi:alpha-pyrone synthase
MSVILDISTAVPEYSFTKADYLEFYARALSDTSMPVITKKLGFLMEKAKITGRHSCIPDFDGRKMELFANKEYQPSAERRMEVYKEKILPLSARAIDPLLMKNKIESSDITHLITVSCTGLFAPGLEFLVADHYDLRHTEKMAFNFLGCYAAIKALKHAHYIATADPKACILIVSAELCSLHFVPSITDEDIIANLLFADGAAAVLVCGKESRHARNKVVLNIDAIGTACLPGTADLMSWDISSSAFRMFLSKHLVNAIRENIQPVVNEFLQENGTEADHWAIHPGGVKIVEAVRDSLHLEENKVEDSMNILKEYGNMSSPTILFILSRILNRIRKDDEKNDQKIVACAFGPGITVEMMRFSSVDNMQANKSKYSSPNYAVQD